MSDTRAQWLQSFKVSRGTRPLFAQLCAESGIRVAPLEFPPDESHVQVEVEELGSMGTLGSMDDYTNELGYQLDHASAPLRQHMASLAEETERLKSELRLTRSKARDAQQRDEKRITEQASQIEDLQSSITSLQAELQHARVKEVSLTAGRTNAEDQLTRSSKAFAKLKTTLDERGKESADRAIKLNFLHNELKGLKGEKDQAVQDWTAQKTRADNLDIDLKQRDDSLKDLRDEISRLNALPKAEEAIAPLNDEIEHLQRTIGERNTENADLRTQNSKLEAELSTAHKQLAELPGLSVRRTRRDNTPGPVTAGASSKTPSPDPRRTSLALELQGRESSGEYAASSDEEVAFDPRLPVVADEPLAITPSAPSDSKSPVTADEPHLGSPATLSTSQQPVAADAPLTTSPEAPSPPKSPAAVAIPPPKSAEKPLTLELFTPLASSPIAPAPPSPPPKPPARIFFSPRSPIRIRAPAGLPHGLGDESLADYFRRNDETLRQLAGRRERERQNKRNMSTQTTESLPPPPPPPTKPTPAGGWKARARAREARLAELGAHWPVSPLNLIVLILLFLMAYQWATLSVEKGVWLAANELTREYLLRVRLAQAHGGAWFHKVLWAYERLLLGGLGVDRGLFS
ncbi:hypothetical protein W97_04962 [Coniosporium apollinis CBS 100218]|uniref:Autophagy-related protein 16 domain-containing protein n=1 Tax=Coniosporium apollinis (strain CBS 100218) TaxID=1168221 RepID=R7YV54_CONA1|nr:uncharacterized protein W97_04962 [Coniosporium apollinis CBS 100218]EON65723.1 hypothetical protein W97_04962 [Coniosporium apollinis CBS 100218]